MKKGIIQFITYNLVGVVNTGFGFSLIFTLMYLGVSATLSNAIGYFFGSILSYYLNKKFTFKTKGKNKSEAVKFFAVLGISYCLNFIILKFFLPLINPYYAQLISAVVYTLSSFTLAKFLVFNDNQNPKGNNDKN